MATPQFHLTADRPTGSPPEKAGARDYSVGLRWSVSLHFLAIALVLIKSLVFPSKTALYVPSLRVDLVGLPDVLKKDLSHVPKTTTQIDNILKKAAEDANKIKPVIPAEKAPEKEAPEKDEMLLKPKQAAQEKLEKKLKSSLARIKSLSKFQDEAQDKPEPAAAPVIKGNKLSAGTSLSGDAKESAEASYLDVLRDRLQDHWELPIWLSRQNFSAQVQLYIDANGRVRNLRFVKASGSTPFDDAVKRAISESQPFPQPPAGIAGSLQVDGILVGFPL